MTDVFISYSRYDKVFVKALHRALAVCQRKTWVDWQSIPLTANWWSEICSGIEKADTFVFVISPHSLASVVCHLEIAQARGLNKRIIPILREEVDFDAALVALAKLRPNDYTRSLLGNQELLALARDNWSDLQRPNWPMLRRVDNFRAGFTKLIEAIELDLDYVREHTRLLVRANEWDKNGRKPSRLLRGEELKRAEIWLSGSIEKEPRPTELHSIFVVASRNAEVRRQRFFLIGSLAAVIVLVLLTLTALWQANVAQTALGTSEARGTEVAQGAETAIAAQATSERRADEAQSVAWSSQAKQAWGDGNFSVALTLALQANSIPSPLAEVAETLYQTAYAPGPRQEVIAPSSVTEYISFSSDGRYVLSNSRDSLILWELESGVVMQSFPSSDDMAVLNRNGDLILSCCSAGLMLWNVNTGEEHQLTTERVRDISGIGFSDDGQTAYSVSADLTITFWDINLETRTRQLSVTAPCGGRETSVFSHDGRFALLQCRNEDFSSGFLLILFDMENEAELRRFSIPNPIADLEFSADGSLAAVGWGLTVSIIDIERGQYLSHILPGSVPTSMVFMPNSRLILVAADPYFDLWDAETGQRIRRLGQQRVEQTISTWDGRQMLYKDWQNNRTWLWDLFNGAEQLRFPVHDILGISDIHFGADGETIDLEVYNDVHLCWSVEDGSQLDTCDFPLHSQSVVDNPPSGCSGYDEAVFSQNGTYALCIREGVNMFGTASIRGDALLLWDIENRTPIRLLEPNTYISQRALFSADGDIFVTGTLIPSYSLRRVQTGLSLWRTANGTRFLELGDQDGLKLLEAFAISPDGRTVATVSCTRLRTDSPCRDAEIIIWRIDTLDELIEWIPQNRYTYELTCEERLAYNVGPYCSANGM